MNTLVTSSLQLDRPAKTSEVEFLWHQKKARVEKKVTLSLSSSSVGTKEIQTMQHFISSSFTFRGSYFLYSLLLTTSTAEESMFNYNTAFCFSFSRFSLSNNHKKVTFFSNDSLDSGKCDSVCKQFQTEELWGSAETQAIN